MKRIYLIVVFAACLLNSKAQNVVLDPSFGINGIARTSFPGLYPSIGYDNVTKKIMKAADGSYYLLFELNEQAIITNIKADGTINTAFANNGYTLPVPMTPQSGALQHDGKIVVAGYSGFTSAFAVVRYNSDGSLDNSFDGDGQVYTLFGNGTSAQSVAVQEDGKIVTAGYSNTEIGRVFALIRYNSDGSLDNSFDGDGKVQTPFKYFKYNDDNHSDATIQSVTIQEDGKIVAAGNSGIQGGSALTVVRYNSDGSLDNSFDGDGKIQMPSSTAESVTLQKDGKIVVTGHSGIGGGAAFTVVRYSSDGSLDNSFDGDGKVETPFIWDGIHSDAYAQSVTVQGDGKIVAAGWSETGVVPAFTLVRYNSDGSLDNSFDGDGKVQTTFADTFATAQSVIVQDNGKIVAAGYIAPGRKVFAVVRYNGDGSLDNSFNGDGKFTGSFNTSVSFFTTAALQGDGKIVAAGTSSSNAFIVARYNTDGSLDNSFNGDGKVQTPFTYDETSLSALVKSVTVQGDGKILAAGSSETGKGSAFTLVRYNSDGSLDNSFDGDGKVLTPFVYDGTNTAASVESVTMQGDGKIVAAGSSYTGTGNVFALVRYNSDGSLDNSFDGDGKVQTPVLYNGTNTSAFAQSVTVQGDGKILAAGYSQTGNGKVFTVVRYNTDGSLDNSFDGDGKVQTPFVYDGTYSDAFAQSVTIQPDGKIVAAGYSQTGTGDAFTLVRYNSDGSLDNSFDGDGKVQTPFIYNGATSALAQSVTIQANGKIVAAGSSSAGSEIAFTAVRYNSDGSLDNTFDGDGKAQVIVPDISFENIYGSTIKGNRAYFLGASRFYGRSGSVAAMLLNDNNNIVISSAPADHYCPSSHFPINYTATGSYNAGNVFTAQLSNASGSFTSPVNIGSKNATGSGTIDAIIPANTAAGSGYRIRIMSSNPALASADNGSNITINGPASPECSTSPMISIKDVTVSESQGTAVLTVTLTDPGARSSAADEKKHGHKHKPKPIEIEYKTVDGTAVSKSRKGDIDYVAEKGTLTFRKGDNTARIRINILRDKVKEGSEYFDVVLSAPKHEDVVFTKKTARVTITDGKGSREMSNTENDVTEKLPEGQLNNMFEIKTYPNPSSNSFNMQVISNGTEKVSIHLFDILGRSIKEISAAPNTVINIGGELKNGIYFAEVIQGQNKVVKKLVKL